VGFDSSFDSRKILYQKLGFTDTYNGTATQNSNMLNLLKGTSNSYYSCSYKGLSFVDALKSIGVDSSFRNRKIIAMNKPIYDKTYTNIGENSSNNILPYEHIVYEIIASNDERLRYTDNYINPYVNTQKCVYSENTYFYRISFYSQNTEYPEISATIEDQIKRIIACILKFDTFIYVGSHDSTSMSIISEYDEMYLQHIAAPDLNAFKFDFVNLTAINSTLYTTNKNYTSSIDFMKYNDISTNIDIYDQKIDDKNDWININDSAISTSEDTVITNWRHYVETEDPVNIKEDNISYFNKNITYNMYALTNQSDYFEGYYTPFSNYSFETLGWRHNSIVKF
jgi:hypothetical protein